MPQVDIGSTYFRSCGAQQRRSFREFRPRELSDLDRPPWTGHHGGEDAVTHVVRYPWEEKLTAQPRLRPLDHQLIIRNCYPCVSGAPPSLRSSPCSSAPAAPWLSRNRFVNPGVISSPSAPTG